jgi:hypothetical protein
MVEMFFSSTLNPKPYLSSLASAAGRLDLYIHSEQPGNISI